MNKQPPVYIIQDAIQQSELDCSDWPAHIQLELAMEIFIALLDKGYNLNDLNKD